MSEFPEQIYRHATYSTVRAWRERLGRYRIVGARCNDCGEIWFPKRTVCPKCNKRNLSPYQCAHTGTIEAFWHNLFLGVRLMGYAEYDVRLPAMIALDDNVRILSEIIEAKPEEVKQGMRVRMVLRKQKRESNGNWMYGYKFVLDKSSQE